MADINRFKITTNGWTILEKGTYNNRTTNIKNK